MTDAVAKDQVFGDAAALIARVDAWLDAFEGPDRGPTDLDDWLRADAVFVEHPNVVNPSGSERDRDAMAAGVEAGRALLARQSYGDRRHLVAATGVVVTRTRWEGELAKDSGPWTAGTVLEADIAMFIEMDVQGRICRQENYDCYRPVVPD